MLSDSNALIPSNLSWDDYQDLPFETKLAFFKRRGRLFNILFSKQFDYAFLETMYVLTNKVRLVSKTKEGKLWLQHLLSGTKVMCYFRQPSTRTFLSFATACQTLGLVFCDVRDPSISSELKGESFEDTIRTFSSYFDLIVMRDPDARKVERASFVLNQTRRPIPIVNAGSGKDEHPTQALLDIFTLRRSFERTGGLSGKTILFAGDLKRGRTVRSLCHLLKHWPGTRLVFSSPKAFRIEPSLRQFLDENQMNYEETEDFKVLIPEVDAIYMTRLQDEYDSSAGESMGYDARKYRFDVDDLGGLKPTAVLLHPLPRRQEIDLWVDSDPRAMYWRQVRNGMWTRVALIAYLFRVDDEILNR